MAGKRISSKDMNQSVKPENIDESVSHIINKIRGNLATVRSFLNLLEMEKYNAGQTEIKELHHRLDFHLENSQSELIKMLETLAIDKHKKD